MKTSNNKLIRIGPEYAFEINNTSATLLKRRVTKKGRVQYDSIGCFSNLEAMYNRMLDIGIANLSSIQAILKRQLEVKNWVRTSLLAISESDDKVFKRFLIQPKGKDRKMRSQVPVSRITDPESSHEAEREINLSGARAAQQELVLSVVRNYPGLTSREMVDYCELDRYQIARRLADLEFAEYVMKGRIRKCRSGGRKCVTWYSIGGE